MAEKKLVEAITSMNEDFAQWYTDVVKKAELIDYSNVKGCMVIKPAGYAIWENIQRQLDDRFKAVGVENVYMPMFIPESLLEKEKDHVEGFAPEVAWVTYGGLNPLPERMCVRPTSETLFCDFYKNDIQSYQNHRTVSDLPLKHCSVIFIRMISSLIVTCRRYITSGAALSVGKRKPDLSCVPESSCGRKDIPHMQRQKRHRHVPSRCLTFMQISVKKYLQSL